MSDAQEILSLSNIIRRQFRKGQGKSLEEIAADLHGQHLPYVVMYAAFMTAGFTVTTLLIDTTVKLCISYGPENRFNHVRTDKKQSKKRNPGTIQDLSYSFVALSWDVESDDAVSP